MNLAQILSLAIFLVMFVTIIIGKVHRYIPALIGATLTLLVVYLIFIAGMMLLIEGLGAVGFFRWLCLLFPRIRYNRNDV